MNRQTKKYLALFVVVIILSAASLLLSGYIKFSVLSGYNSFSSKGFDWEYFMSPAGTQVFDSNCAGISGEQSVSTNSIDKTSLTMSSDSATTNRCERTGASGSISLLLNTDLTKIDKLSVSGSGTSNLVTGIGGDAHVSASIVKNGIIVNTPVVMSNAYGSIVVEKKINDLFVTFSGSGTSVINITGANSAYLLITVATSAPSSRQINDRFTGQHSTASYAINAVTAETYTLNLTSNQLLAMETFGAGRTISKYSTRYPVVQFSKINPVIITDNEKKQVSLSTAIYDDLNAGNVLNIPVNQTWTLFYVINNNGQLPTLCDNGAVDVLTGLCTSIPTGIVTICSEGQLDPSTGLCVVQGTVKTICEFGRFDTTQGICIYNPPTQAVCLSGSVYNIDTQKCEFTPQVEAICSSGYTYNIQKNVCETFPSSVINCPPNYAYDSSTNKCVNTPISEIVCASGSNFNAATGKCEYNPGTVTVCASPFVFNSATNICEFKPENSVICNSGTYDVLTQKCITYASAVTVCTKGVFDTSLDACIYTPETVGSCLQGTYDSNRNACIISPNMQYLCLQGAYNPITNVCEITPESKIVCTTGFVYDSKIDKCVKTGISEGVTTEIIVVTIVIILLLIVIVSKLLYKRR